VDKRWEKIDSFELARLARRGGAAAVDAYLEERTPPAVQGVYPPDPCAEALAGGPSANPLAEAYKAEAYKAEARREALRGRLSPAAARLLAESDPDVVARVEKRLADPAERALILKSEAKVVAGAEQRLRQKALEIDAIRVKGLSGGQHGKRFDAVVKAYEADEAWLRVAGW